VLHAAGFTDRRLSPFEEHKLLEKGCGITNLVERATAGADDLSRAEIVEGGRRLAAKVRRYRPRFVAVLGIGAYRIAFDRPKATIGRQELSIGPAGLWVLPSPSGLNAHYRFAELVSIYEELRRAAAEG
jgi:TDG/mug DNA glycosylase family protein